MSNCLELIKSALAADGNLHDCITEVYGNSKKGEGMLAVIQRILFSGKDEDNRIHIEKLVLKTAPTHEVFKSSTPIHNMYVNEIYAFQTVLPTLRNTSENFNINFVTYPRCKLSGFTSNEEFLVLEDLNECGYKIWNNKDVMDDSHMFLVLDNLAKFHAPSFYLKTTLPEEWKKVTTSFNDVHAEFLSKTQYCDAVIDMAKTLDNIFEGRGEVLKRFANFRDTELKSFMGRTCSDYDPDFVIIHGDLWSNNLLFKYEDKTDQRKPTDVAFLDFQAIRLSSLALDLSYFFYICATKQKIDSLDVYLSYYYEKLSEYLQKMNLNPQSIFPYSSFLNQWKKYNKFGLSMALVVLHGVTSDADEFPGLEDLIDSGENYWFALNFRSKHEDQYRERIRDVILHFYDRNYI